MTIIIEKKGKARIHDNLVCTLFISSKMYNPLIMYMYIIFLRSKWRSGGVLSLSASGIGATEVFYTDEGTQAVIQILSHSKSLMMRNWGQGGFWSFFGMSWGNPLSLFAAKEYPVLKALYRIWFGVWATHKMKISSVMKKGSIDLESAFPPSWSMLRHTTHYSLEPIK